jgi:hypothetical protein
MILFPKENCSNSKAIKAMQDKRCPNFPKKIIRQKRKGISMHFDKILSKGFAFLEIRLMFSIVLQI